MSGIGIGVGLAVIGSDPPIPMEFNVAWFRADKDVVTSTGIARWIDKSASPIPAHMSQIVAASKPVLSGSGTAQELTFDGTSDYLDGDPLADLGGANTIGIAAQALSDNSGGVAQRWWLECGNPNATGVVVAITNHTPARRRISYCSGTAALADWGSATTDPETWVIRHDGAGGNADFCLNGSHQTTLTGKAQCVAPTNGSSVGAKGNNTLHADVKIWAIIAYSTRLSDADTILLSTYLTNLRNGTPSGSPPGTPILWLERPDLNAGEGVSSWINQNLTVLTGTMDQSTLANQPVLIPSAINGKPGIHFNETSDKLAWSDLASDFNFQHNGTGSTVCTIATTTNIGTAGGNIHDTGASGAQRGMGLQHQSGSQAVIYRIHNGTDMVYTAQSPADSWPLDTSACLVLKNKSGSNPQIEARINGSVVLSDSFDFEPSSEDAFGPMEIGDRVSGTYLWGGFITDIFMYNEYLTTSNVVKLESYAAARYGITGSA